MEAIITGIISLFSTIVASISTWFLTKRKYKAETSNLEINNLKTTFLTYQDIINSTSLQLKDYNDRVQKAEKSISILQNHIYDLKKYLCFNLHCSSRSFSQNLYDKNFDFSLYTFNFNKKTKNLHTQIIQQKKTNNIDVLNEQDM